jgi:hypothetical protein
MDGWMISLANPVGCWLHGFNLALQHFRSCRRRPQQPAVLRLLM